MQSPSDRSNLPILTDRAVLYGSTGYQMSTQASPQQQEKSADLGMSNLREVLISCFDL